MKEKPVAKKSLILAGLLLMTGWTGGNARALTWTDEVTSLTKIESHNMVFNLAQGLLNPPQRLEGWNSGSGPDMTPLDMGDGSLGAFSISTFSLFGTVVGSTVTINTDAAGFYPLQVTSFDLPAGYTLRGVGSNPLDIRSQTDIVVSGTIDCSGESGEAIGSNNLVTSQGGTGHCGGGAGGNGGSTTVDPTDGIAGGASVTGGLGASSVNVAPAATPIGATGGGGGGAYRQLGTPPENGYDSAAVLWAGSGGINFRDDQFSEIGGGSGGGGGSAYDGIIVADRSSGGGGGVGGGVVLLRAVRDITVSGSVLARGGDGGGTIGTLRAGGGGGGGGGSIGVWAGRNLSFTGVISATNGSGGISGIDPTHVLDQGGGGNGSEGRTWITDKDKCTAGDCPSTEIPTTLLTDEGRVLYQTGTFTILSKVIDLGNSQPSFTSATVSGHLGTGSSVGIEIASGSTDDFDATGLWISSSTLAGQIIGRYIRFRLTIDNQDTTSATVVDSIAINYEGRLQENFNLISTCGGINADSGSLSRIFMWILFMGLPLVLLLGSKLAWQDLPFKSKSPSGRSS
ncbi:MAG: hypothetical protein IPL83_04415 [Bdellovibrionales bacterium]|nr:hypothetical protein [Bdellovibrionales bacterium]